MARTLRAVQDGDLPPLEPPKNLVEATERSRREFLVMSRHRIAAEIDGGTVPAHALARLIAEMDRIDLEIRRMDAADAQEAERREQQERHQRTYDPAAI